MSLGQDANAESTLRASRSYSAQLQRVFNVAALIVAFLPVPVALLELVPAYRSHTRFLMFYAPVVCLLTLAYLLYIRDALARFMFAHVLKPVARSTSYRERSHLRARRIWMRLRIVLLAMLPAALLLGSLGFMMRYTDRLNESAAVASVSVAAPLGSPEDVGAAEEGQVEGESGAAPGERRPRRRASTRDSSTGDSAYAGTITSTPDLLALRREVLASAPISDIPYFTELTALYIGSFLCALVALVLMAVREYAREALGLSEQDVVLGRVLGSEDDL